MERKVNILSIALFTFLLMLPGALWAHDDEHQTEGGHGSPELYEEGSGMKMHSEKMAPIKSAVNKVNTRNPPNIWKKGVA